MGREIRRVPRDWEHPKDDDGHYIAMYDKTYDEAADEWIEGFKNFAPDEYNYYWEWAGNPPDPDYYRPEFKDEASCYQIYETVSEGTPTSPVFESLDEMEKWLTDEGYNDTAIKNFIKIGKAPSFAFINDALYSNIQACGAKYETTSQI